MSRGYPSRHGIRGGLGMSRLGTHPLPGPWSHVPVIGYHGIQLPSGWYAFYWNTFLFFFFACRYFFIRSALTFISQC